MFSDGAKGLVSAFFEAQKINKNVTLRDLLRLKDNLDSFMKNQECLAEHYVAYTSIQKLLNEIRSLPDQPDQDNEYCYGSRFK